MLAAVGVFLAVWSRTSVPASDAEILEWRLRTYYGDVPNVDDIELQRPFVERIGVPAMQSVGRQLSRSAPDKTRAELHRKLQFIGRPLGLGGSEFIGIRYLGTVVLFLLGIVPGVLAGNPLLIAAGGFIGAIAGLYLPLIWLNQMVSGRRRNIRLSLPNTLDLLSVCVEAGLTFEAAMARVTEKYHNALSDEFASVLRETRLGRPRLEALDEMGRHSGVEDLHHFVQAVIQSEQLGTGLTRVLRVQAEEIRIRRRQRAQEAGARAPLKMIMPMIGCIFPTIWVLLLGPALLIVLDSLGTG
jgi:tight adherence protein C